MNEVDRIDREFREHRKSCPVCGKSVSGMCPVGAAILIKFGEELAKPETTEAA
jgi:hypothetical protein